MDTESLTAFVEVAKKGSFSGAAQSLFLTQPAVSKRISKLEEKLNHRLFDRLGRELRLTEAGQTLMPRAESLLQDWDDLTRNIRELSGEIVGTLRVATSHHIGLHYLPPILREFAIAHSNVNLQFDFLESEQAHQKVLHGECELAIVTLAPNIQTPLEDETLWEDPMALVVSHNHPLVENTRIDLEALSQTPAILPDLNTYTGRLIKQIFEDKKLDIQVSMTTNYLETIKMMVTVGLGWSILPRTMLDSQLLEIHLDDIQISRDLGIVVHKKRSISNAGRAFLGILRRRVSLNTSDSRVKAFTVSP